MLDVYIWTSFTTTARTLRSILRGRLFLERNSLKPSFFWAQDDIFFTREGGEAFLADLPKAEMHRLEAGHFAVEDCLDYISKHMHRFYDERVGANSNH
jgi:hypothetical protein